MGIMNMMFLIPNLQLMTTVHEWVDSNGICYGIYKAEKNNWFGVVLENGK